MTNGKEDFHECLDEKGKIIHYQLLEYLIRTENFANTRERLFHYDGDSTGAWFDITDDVPNLAIHRYIPEVYQTRVDALTVKRIIADLIACAKIGRKFEDHPNLLNVENCVIDLTKKTVNAHDRKYGFCYVRRFKYYDDSDIKKASAFCQYITSSLGCEDMDSPNVKQIIEVMGYVVSAKRNADVAIYLLGDSNVGKSQWLNLLESVFDSNEVSSVGLHELGSVFRFATLAYSKVNILHEIKPVCIKSVDVLKKVVSCEPVLAEEKGKKPRRIIPKTVLVSATNNMPFFATTELNNSLVNRMLVIRFMGTIARNQINRNLFQQLTTEKDLIFSVAIDHLRLLIQNNMLFTVPIATQVFMEAYSKSLNSVKIFIEECSEVQSGQKVFSKNFYESYVRFTRENMLYTHSFLSFGSVIRSLQGVENKKIRIGNKSFQGYEGIGLKK